MLEEYRNKNKNQAQQRSLEDSAVSKRSINSQKPH